MKKPSLKIPPASSLKSTPANIKEVAVLAQRQMALEDEINKIDELLESKTKTLYQLKTVDLPNAMESAGTKAITLTDGSEVKIDDFVTANIKEADRPAAHAWLRANKLGSLIKNTITCAFGMGEDKTAKAAKAALKKLKIGFEEKEAVNAMTLRAFAREQLARGKALPLSISVTTVPTAIIKRIKSS